MALSPGILPITKETHLKQSRNNFWLKYKFTSFSSSIKLFEFLISSLCCDACSFMHFKLLACLWFVWSFCVFHVFSCLRLRVDICSLISVIKEWVLLEWGVLLNVLLNPHVKTGLVQWKWRSGNGRVLDYVGQ